MKIINYKLSFSLLGLSIILLLLMLSSIELSAENRFIDTVYSFTPGTGQNAGQSETYYPMNIYGAPFENADVSTPASSPKDLLCLGMGGEIIVGIIDGYIVNGPGADFTIFENVMKNFVTDKYFVEPAVVSVSYDGINYFEFPWNEETLEGCAGTLPTFGSENPFDSEKSGGNSFDLEILGLERIKYIKIKDTTKYLVDNPEHLYYDPMLTGFDLDAIACINTEIDNTMSSEEISIDEIKDDFYIELYNYVGEIVFRGSYSDYKGNEFHSGLYFINVYNKGKIISRKKVCKCSN